SLPDETIFKIFEILEENRRSFWCNESRNLAQTCMRFEDLYLNRRKHQLLLDEAEILRVRKSHDENDENIVGILTVPNIDSLSHLTLSGFCRYFRKILGLICEHGHFKSLKTFTIEDSSGGFVFEEFRR
ncbi:unnamed protein product, partial [Oikopleura dioica]